MSPAVNPSTRNIPFDRRRRRHCPITAPGECLIEGRRADVVATGISCARILVQSAEILPTGARVELHVNWPWRLDSRCPLRLVVDGQVLRTTARGTFIGVKQYEYRLTPQD